MTSRLLLSILLLLLAACSGLGPRERDAQRLAEYEGYAGEPIEGFSYFTLQRFVSLGRYDLVVYTRINEAFLLTVEPPCSGLEFAKAIGLSATGNRVSRRFDFVRFENQQCRIEQIRPIDVRAMKQARHAD